MAIEDTLNEINSSLKTIVTILQSAGAISASETGTATSTVAPETEARKPGRPKKSETATTAGTGLGLVPGDPEGTRYWVSETLLTVYAQKPGDPDPADQTFKIESAPQYVLKKDEFAKKSKQATAAQTTETAATPATNTPAASTASSGPAWSVVLDAIKELNKGMAPGQGRDGVMATLAKFGLEGKKVPDLEGIGKHADVLAFVTGLLKPAASEDDLGI